MTIYRSDRAEGRAHWVVADAISKGVLVPQPCERCGAPYAEAHHDDYSKPLEVIWLCPKDHRRLHRERGDYPPPPERPLRQPLAVALPPELVAEIDAMAAAMERSRAKVVEFACREYVQAHRHKTAAA